MTTYPPSVPIARLYEKTSARGLRYFAGRMGMARVSLLPSSEVSEIGDPIWLLHVQEAPAPETRTLPPAVPRRTPARRRIAVPGARIADDSVTDLWRDDAGPS
jgi:hypothetical protein